VVLHDFVVEDGEIQSETELDGIAWRESNLVSLVVGFESVLFNLLKKAILGVLGDVTVVVTNHLYEESFGLTIAALGKNFGVDHVDDALAVTSEFAFDGLLVGSESVGVLAVLGVLLDGGNCAASSAFGADEVLEGNREEIALVT
jgi:hypothetical protein